MLSVIRLDRVGDDGETNLFHGAMPPGSGVVRAGQNGLIYLGVGEGFVLALVPAEARKHPETLRDHLLRVIANAVCERAKMLVKGDGRNSYSILGGVSPIEEILDGLAIGAHVCAVGVEEQPFGRSEEHTSELQSL